VGWVTALAIVLSAASSATTGDVELSLRSEGRSSTLEPTASASEARAALSTAGRVSAFLETPSARAAGGYGLELSTLDVGAMRTPAVNQRLGVRLESRGDSALRAEVSLDATRARTEPLTDVSAVAATGGAQVLTTGVVDTESLRGGVKGSFAGERASLEVGASTNVNRGTDPASGSAFPSQWGFGVDSTASYAVTERDRVGVSAGASRTVPSNAQVSTTSDVASLTGTWKRALSPTTQGSVGAGVGVTRDEQPPSAAAFPGVVRRAPARIGVAPAADVGLGHRTSALGISAWARVATFVDRFTGSASPMAGAGCSVSWTATETLSLAATGSGGSRLDGVSSFGALDVHAAWRLRPGLDLELGVLGRTQHDVRAQTPSFVETGGYVALSYATGPLLGVGTR
jgi:hypothetical protein